MELRCIYLATHFENAYQTWDLDEVLAYVREMADMGANSVGFWLDQHEYRFADMDVEGSLAWIRWQRLARISEVAHDLGMKTLLAFVANESYEDQVTSELKADVSGRSGRSFYPTQLCLSNRLGEEICLENMVDIIRRIPFVDYISSAAYDQGGCDCPRCAPWVRKYVQHSAKMLKAARLINPEIEMILTTWNMNSLEDLEMLDEANKVFSDDAYILFNQDSRHKEHGLDAIALTEMPHVKKMKLIGFSEISMLASTVLGSCQWGGFGANPVPWHLADRLNTQRNLLAGMIVYSEGIYEDLNKWVILQLGKYPSKSVEDVLADYARKYISPAIPTADFVELIYRLEKNWRHFDDLPDAVETGKLANAIRKILTQAEQSNWRWQILDLRITLDELVARAREYGLPSVHAEIEAALQQLLRVYRCGTFIYPEISVAAMERCRFFEK